jgi:hypothetical protein
MPIAVDGASAISFNDYGANNKAITLGKDSLILDKKPIPPHFLWILSVVLGFNPN